MKLKPTLAASLLAILAAPSINASAASDTPYDPTNKGHAIGAS